MDYIGLGAVKAKGAPIGGIHGIGCYDYGIDGIGYGDGYYGWPCAEAYDGYGDGKTLGYEMQAATIFGNPPQPPDEAT